MAFDGAAVAQEWYAAHRICWMHEDDHGAVSPEVADWNCEKRERLTRELEEHGYCFDSGEREWYPCLPTS